MNFIIYLSLLMVDIKCMMSLENIYNRFTNKKECVEYLEYLRWNNNPFCPYCNSKHFTQLKENNRYHCNTCNTSYSVTVDTIFHKTRIDLQKWFYAIHLITKFNPKISSRELAKEIKTTKDTSWRLINEVKKALTTQDSLLKKIIEND